MNHEYLVPGELVAMALFVFVPPLLIASAGQLWFFARHGVSKPRAALLLGVTVLVSFLLGAGLFAYGSEFLPGWVGMKVIWFGENSVLVMPLAFIVVAIVAPVVSLLAVRRNESA